MRLEEGKSYHTASGALLGPMKVWTDVVMHVGDDRRWSTATGEQLPPYRHPAKLDLVHEYGVPDDVGVEHDPVNHPRHYTGHPSGVECIEITEHMNFCRGNAVKYIWRAGDKGDEIEDLKKARWYLDREIARLEKA